MSSKNVLVIPDLHCPAMHPQAIRFLKRVQKEHNCGKVIFIGDIVDHAAMSYHEKATGMASATDEFLAAYKQVRRLYKAFPRATWITGNHDCLSKRQAETAGIPTEFIKPLNEVYNVSGWKMVQRYDEYEHNGVFYLHGDKGRGGQRNPAYSNAVERGINIVQGHHHSAAGVEWIETGHKQVFGMQVGCLVDPDALAFSYGRKFNRKPMLGCGVVINGKPQFIPF